LVFGGQPPQRRRCLSRQSFSQQLCELAVFTELELPPLIAHERLPLGLAGPIAFFFSESSALLELALSTLLGTLAREGRLPSVRTLVAMLSVAQPSEAPSGLGSEDGFEGHLQPLVGPFGADGRLACQDLGRHLGNALVLSHGLPLPHDIRTGEAAPVKSGDRRPERQTPVAP
jgi:hypothetical protein